MARPGALLFWILGLAALVRAVPAVRRPLQVDEAYALHVAAMPPGQILQVLKEVDVHPPLFWLALHLLAPASTPDVVLRLVMAALGVAGVALLYAVVRAWHDQRAALVAAFCAALMPSLIFYDITIRMYVLFDLLALSSFALLSVLYTRADLPAARRRLAWAAWTVTIALLIYTQYLGFMVIAAQLLYAGFARREGLVRSLAGTIAAVLAWLPQLPTFLAQLAQGGLAFPFYAGHELSALYELVGQATIAPQTHGAAYFVGWTSLIAWAWLAAAFVLAAPGNSRSLPLWLCMPALLTLCYGALAHKLLFVDRYYLLLALGLCALSGMAASRLAQRRTASPLPGWAAALALATLGMMYAFDPQYYTADWPAIGRLLQARSESGDLIIFDQGSPFFALDRAKALGHHPLILVFHRRDLRQTVRLARPFRRVWLVLFQSGPVDPDGEILHGLASRYRLAGYWEYFRRLPAEGASVVFFQR